MRVGQCGLVCAVTLQDLHILGPGGLNSPTAFIELSLLSAARNATRQNIPAWPRSTAGFYGRDKKKQKNYCNNYSSNKQRLCSLMRSTCLQVFKSFIIQHKIICVQIICIVRSILYMETAVAKTTMVDEQQLLLQAKLATHPFQKVCVNLLSHIVQKYLILKGA